MTNKRRLHYWFSSCIRACGFFGDVHLKVVWVHMHSFNSSCLIYRVSCNHFAPSAVLVKAHYDFSGSFPKASVDTYVHFE